MTKSVEQVIESAEMQLHNRRAHFFQQLGRLQYIRDQLMKNTDPLQNESLVKAVKSTEEDVELSSNKYDGVRDFLFSLFGPEIVNPICARVEGEENTKELRKFYLGR
jgi:hypothetical protein